MRSSFLLLLLIILAVPACRTRLNDQQSRGAAAISKYGCGSCHTVEGIQGANGLVGPPLTGIGSRQYVAGMLRNTPDNLATWIQDPKAVNPKTAMPNVGASAKDARDMAVYLETK